jgi:hypothetical protein
MKPSPAVNTAPVTGWINAPPIFPMKAPKEVTRPTLVRGTTSVIVEKIDNEKP